jgi:lipopolysaccharide transport system ATP-binding protein
MSETVIKVENLSKQYRIGTREAYKTFQETLVDIAKAPIQQLGRLFNRQSSIVNRHSETIWALKDVSFEVERGEVVGIIGRNGAGKTTLLKILSRITEPTKGRAELRGRVGSLLEVGTGFHSELTGHENIYLYGAILGMDRWEVTRKFDEIVAFAELEKFIDTPVKRYSSGMYVRLAFAVAAHLEPEILLVDEVLAVGDAQFQKKCLGKMKEVGKEGRTILFVSHNMAAVEALCSSGMLLINGKLIFEGTSNDTIRKYENISRGYTITDVANRKDRQGNQLAKCINLQILDNLNQPTNSVTMGSNFSVEITVTGNLSHAIIGILIGNLYKTQMIRGYTYESYNGEIHIKGKTTVRCTFYNFPMMHGIYDIHIWIGRQRELADYVENAAELIIEPRDVFGTGRMIDPNNGVAFCKHTWKIMA